MRAIFNDVNEKKYEASILLNLVKDKGDSKHSVLTTAILKSSYILLLYNMIESTLTLVIERIHDDLSSTMYKSLCSEIKSLWVTFYFKKHPEKFYEDNFENSLNGTLKFPKYSEYCKRVKVFSGNLDAREISKILRNYGIGQLCTLDRDLLLIVKNKRNKLAHGEQMFKEACRDMTLNEMEKCQEATFGALDSILEQTEVYLSEKKYLAQP